MYYRPSGIRETPPPIYLHAPRPEITATGPAPKFFWIGSRQKYSPGSTGRRATVAKSSPQFISTQARENYMECIQTHSRQRIQHICAEIQRTVPRSKTHCVESGGGSPGREPSNGHVPRAITRPWDGWTPRRCVQRVGHKGGVCVDRRHIGPPSRRTALQERGELLCALRRSNSPRESPVQPATMELTRSNAARVLRPHRRVHPPGRLPALMRRRHASRRARRRPRVYRRAL